MRLDRALQLQILEFLREQYPSPGKLQTQEFSRHPHFVGTCFYLEEHGLISRPHVNFAGEKMTAGDPTITAQGLDFLEDDGGVSAILKTVTIRFDPDNIRRLVEEKVLALNLPKKKEETALSTLKGLSVEGLKTLVDKIIKKGIESPDLLLRLISSLGA